MKHDFDRALDRTQTNDLKWRVENMRLYGIEANAESIPMWIADTDFPCAPVIVDALRQRVEKEIFGYCAPMKPFFEAIQYWMRTQFGWEIDPGWITSVPSVVGSINIAVRTFSKPGDGVIVQTPVYNPFMETVEAAGRVIRNNQLRNDDGRYSIDFEELERLASEKDTTMMILCSPHNPVGRVWTKEELIRIGDICLAHNVTLVSDEIHSGVIYSGHTHHAMTSLKSEYEKKFIYLNSPAKAFNVPGLKVSYAIIADEGMRKAFRKTQSAMSLSVNSTFGIEAVTAAYSPEGAEWLRQVVEYVEGNRDYTVRFIRENLQGKIKLQPPEGCFLCWLDFSPMGMDPGELRDIMLKKANVVCGFGSIYGPGGENFLRFNIGTQRALVEKALDRIKRAYIG